MPTNILFLFIALLYLATFCFALRALWGARRSNDFKSFRRQNFSADFSLLIVAVAVHGFVLVKVSILGPNMQFGFAHATSAMLLVAAVVYLIESRVAPIGLIRLILAPAATIAALLPIVFPGSVLRPAKSALEFEIHFALAMLAYGLIAVAALHAAAMMLIDFVLHHPRLLNARSKQSSRWRQVFLDLSPPVLVVEQLLFKTLAFGFAALTLTLVTGVGFHEYVFGQPLSFDHKTVFSILSWMTFAALIFGRWRYGWRGRVALRYVLIGFVLLLLAYMGTHFVLEVMLGRHG